MKNRRKLSETIMRYLRVLQMVPQGRRIDAATIERQLEDEGIEIHRRSVQRDLEMLSTSFPGLTCDRSTKPVRLDVGVLGASHRASADGHGDGGDARVVADVRVAGDAAGHTQGRCSRTSSERGPRCCCRAPGCGWRAGLARSRLLPKGMPLLPASVSDAVLETVYTALLEERQFHMRYRKRGAERDKEYDVDPLGLVVRGGMLVLVCLLSGEDKIKQINLHRIKTAHLWDKPARIPVNFQLDDYVQEGGVAFKLGKSIRLKMIMDRAASITLHETPLERTQQITSVDDYRELVEATVPDTLELRGWILSYGELIEVIEPKELREHMARVSREMAARYTKPAVVKKAGRESANPPPPEAPRLTRIRA